MISLLALSGIDNSVVSIYSFSAGLFIWELMVVDVLGLAKRVWRSSVFNYF